MIMCVVHLSYDYGLSGTSGAPIAASRLHLALLRRGIDSHFVCVRRLEEGPNVHRLPTTWLGRKLFYLIPRVFWVLSKAFCGQLLMPNIWPLPGFSKLMRGLRPDIVHMHLIGQDMVSFAQLAKVKAKFVYTLHDLTAVNAVEPHVRDDRRFAEGFVSRNSTCAERWMFARKRRFLAATRPLFTGPSDWICGMFRQSLLGRGFEVSRVLNIVDPVYGFDPALRVSSEKFTILFGAFGGRSSPYKGWPDLEAALRLLPAEMRAKTEVVVFGEKAEDYSIDGVTVRFVGAIQDPQALRRLHHRADVLALPSRQDNAPQVKFEALLDGLPVIAFARTGCAEFIESGRNGWVALDGDMKGYAEGLASFFARWQRGELAAQRAVVAESAAKAFDERLIIERMLAIYGRLVGN